MIERDNLIAALDAYLKKQIEAHFEGRTPAVTPAAGTTPPVTKDLGDNSRVEIKRGEVIRVLTRFNVDPTGMNDSQLADAMYKLSPEVNRYTIVDD